MSTTRPRINNHSNAQVFTYWTDSPLTKQQQYILWQIRNMPHMSYKAKLTAIVRCHICFTDNKLAYCGSLSTAYTIAEQFIWTEAANKLNIPSKYFCSLNKALMLTSPDYDLNQAAAYKDCRINNNKLQATLRACIKRHKQYAVDAIVTAYKLDAV